jgi:ligand-binding sensor domain-containing protein/serine phosphatase RsbU (regulator of sigma subunit)
MRNNAMKYFSTPKFLAVFVFAILSGGYFAQQYNFKTFTQENGLPQSYIYAFKQTAWGYMAVGTGEGLSFTGGTSFRSYTTKDGLAENFVTALENDNDGNLWIGHYQNGISTLKENKFSPFKDYPNNIGPVNCLFNYDNKMWVGNKTDNFCYIENNALVKIPHSILKKVNAYAALGDRIVAATGNGVFIGSKQNGKYVFTQSPRTSGLNITAIESIGDSLLICGDESGIVRIAELKKNKTEPDFNFIIVLSTQAPVKNIVTDVWNNVWIASFGGGIEKLRVQDLPNPNPLQKTHINEKNGISNVFIQTIYRDREENIWLGTFGGGIYMLENDNLQVYNRKSGLPEEEILAVASASGKLITGTLGGLQVCDLPDGSGSEFYNAKNGFVDDEVKCLSVNKKTGEVIVGTRTNGAFYFDVKKKKFLKISISSNNINHINIVSDTLILFSTVDGLYFYNPAKKTFRQLTTSEGLPHNHIVQTLVDKKNRIWLAAHHSPLAMIYNDSVTLFKDIDLFKSFSITSLCMDKAGKLYFGTDGDGLFYESGKTFSRKSAEDGLCSNYIYGLVFDSINNSVICTHRNGLSKWNPGENVIHRLNKKEKLSAFENNLNSIFSSSNSDLIFFGTSQGVCVYQSSRGKLNDKPPIFKVLAVSINDKPYETTDTIIKLPYGSYNLRFDFLGISFRSSEEVRYHYKLEGLNTEFKSTSERFVEFPKVREGDYTFRIFSENADGIRNQQPYMIRITIDKPLYKKFWFLFLALAVLLFGTWIFLRLRLRRLEKINRVLEQKVKEKTKEIEEDKAIIEQINKDLEGVNAEITASIDYAKRIQVALLPKKQAIQKNLDSVIFYRPRDIVSGDFYWYHETKDWYYFAVVDCTGHGVPGAFMSIIGSNFLDQIIADSGDPQPAEMLHELDKRVVSSLKQRSGDARLKDGMDIALCKISKDKTKIIFSGASRPLWHISNGVLKEIISPLFPIGGYYEGIEKHFKNTEIQIAKGDWIYVSSDGFGDQFGGPDRKRYSAKKMKELVTKLSQYKPQEQYEIIRREYKEWKGEESQVDDILLAGIKF